MPAEETYNAALELWTRMLDGSERISFVVTANDADRLIAALREARGRGRGVGRCTGTVWM